MLWTLLILVSSSSLIGGAVAAVRTVNGGGPDYAVAIITGLLLALANLWGWSRIAKAMNTHIQLLQEAQQERYLRPMYLAAAIWCFWLLKICC